MVSTVSPKGDGKRQITHEASQLRHQTERIVVQKEGGDGVTGVCVRSPNWMTAVVVLPVSGVL